MSTPTDTLPARPPRWGLRLQIHTLVALLTGVFVAVLVALQIDSTRRSVHEEIVAANRVASQLLQRVTWVYTRAGPGAMGQFLEQLGRVRANDITLESDTGEVLFRSPPSIYKQGREAPAWYSTLVAPLPQRQVIDLPGGRLTVEADPSRAILDGWDELQRLALLGAGALVLLHLGVFWLVGRALRPWPTIVTGLSRLREGDYHVRLPALPGKEASLIGREVNRLAAAIEEQLDARLRAFEAERRLSEHREFMRRLEAHTDAERRAIARELHDEFAQSVTAIRSLARGLQQRLDRQHDDSGAQAARLIGDEAARLYDAMHGLIPRLSPPALDELGLPDALTGLVDRTRASHPGITLEWQAPADRDALARALPRDVARTLYAVAQEGLTNALRHSGARHLALALHGHADRATLQLEDDGIGLPADAQTRGRHGLRGLLERVQALGGELELAARDDTAGADGRPGTRLRATLPLTPSPPEGLG
ncbi:two-component system sensor histidine kinase UhpB [Sphaerotilus hippei]|uniref:histidine kinase n=1 Tax=Sphaerotilus hippei TaxID=744406 RepID=A0A318H6B5_9BURK|nr:histidine kinase [Sphaerotilus hippei]PXW99530.1 two-component system sensor histidine kinase UhpB [Sphaerotilus hippei]